MSAQKKALAGPMALAIHLRKTGLPQVYHPDEARQPTPGRIALHSSVGSGFVTSGIGPDRRR